MFLLPTFVLHVMRERGKIRLKTLLTFAATAIVFLISFHTDAKHRGHNFSFHISAPNVDSPPAVKRPLSKGVAPTSSKQKTTTRASTKDPLTPRAVTDTPPPAPLPDTLTTGDTTLRDTTLLTKDTLNVKLSKDTLQAPVDYSAEDSGVLIIPTKEFILYGKAHAKYTDLEVTAQTINLNQEKHLLSAYGSTDTTGNPLNKPKLVQGDMTSISDTILYNTTSQKGLTKSTYLQEGEIFVYAQTVKKVNENTLYAWRGRFTTCNLDTPHFAFRTRKLKMITNNIAVSGPAAPEFEGVPMPIGIPFGIYPLNRGRHSGLLPPQYAANDQYGIGLEGLGYYKVLNDNIDVTVRTDLYSYGGWNVNINSRYLKRYRYTGSANLAVQNVRILNTSGQKEEFTHSRNYSLQWSYSRDPKARPGSSFNANVNVASTQFNRYVANNAIQNFQNQLSSSIAYSKDWKGKYNLTLSANHSQNNVSRLINVTLPTASFNVLTLYPFQKKEAVGTPKWYEKLGVGYTGSFLNQMAFYDSAFNLRSILDTAQYGATHNLPITLSLPQLGPVQIAPSVSYEEHWFGQKTIYTWNDSAKKVDTVTSRGLYTARQMQFGISTSTRIFGTMQFRKGSIKAIRHEIRPTIGLNYRPDMQKSNYYNVQIDASGTIERVSKFRSGNVVSPFGEGRFGGISFGLDNVLEMKVRNKKDTSEAATRKVRLIDGFGFNGSYNLFPSKLDSFPLSNISLYARSTLFEKVNITASANLDPYETDIYGRRHPRLILKDKAPKLGRITSGSIALSTSLQSKPKDGKSDKDRIPQDEFMTPDEQQRQLDFIRSNPAEYADFNIPWSLQLSYSLNFYKQLRSTGVGFENKTTQNVNVNGDFSLTPRWKMGGNTYYDITTHKVQTLTMFITREMHCWQMSINITPVGLFRSFSININPKSGLLRDLKINRSRFFYQ